MKEIRKIKSIILIVLCLVLSNNLQSQVYDTVYIEVKDINSNEAIPNATIKIESTNIFWLTDSNGKATLIYDRKKITELKIKATHLLYSTYKIGANCNNGKSKMVLYLSRRSADIIR